MKHGESRLTEAAAAKAGFSARSGCRINQDPTLPSRKKAPRGRRRPDPLAGMFEEEVVPMLEADPGIRAFGVFEEPMRRRPDPNPGVRRALERRIRDWRARHGPDQEAVFRQTREPGRLGLSDFANMNALGGAIAGQPPARRLLATFAADRHGIRPCALEVGHLDVDTILAFLDLLEAERGNSVNSRNTRLASLKSFFRFLEFRYPDHLDRDEVDALFKAPDAATKSGTRDRAMLCLACNAGLRVSELVGLGLDDVRMPQLDEIRGMGKRARVLPLWKETGRALGAWPSIRPEVPDRLLFLNAMGRGMTRRGFAKRLALHVATAARAKPSIARRKAVPHVIRHACALHTLEATGDIRKVSLWLGHQGLQTTEMYLRTDPAEKLDVLSEWRSPDLGKGRFTGVKDALLAMLSNV